MGTDRSTATDDSRPGPAGWRDVLAALRRPRVALMLLLGISSGIPFMLTGNTLGFWLREGGVDLAAIGFLAWVGLTYTLKFLWAPLVDRIDAPFLGRRLGRRRGWMLLSQLTVGVGLVGISITGPAEGAAGALGTLALFALLAAFASATQDVVVDAWRIETAADREELGLLTAAYALGYRTALLATDALILIAAAQIGWPGSYLASAVAMGIGVFATLAATEPARANPTAGGRAAALWTPRGAYDAIVGPIVTFFRDHRDLALLMLAAISLYRLGDFVMGPMINPFYVDLGLTKETVGAVRGTVGFWATFVGVALAGVAAVKLGMGRTLVIGAVIGPGSNLAFSLMAVTGPDLTVFTLAMLVDNIAQGFAGTSLIAYMSSLTSVAYTATQYALLSSFYALLGKVLKGFSGQAVQALDRGMDILTAYAVFFAGTAAIGIPALLLCIALERRTRTVRAPGQAGAAPAAAE